jgi:hypothetical protein
LFFDGLVSIEKSRIARGFSLFRTEGSTIRIVRIAGICFTLGKHGYFALCCTKNIHQAGNETFLQAD